jgi:hypothetical protein
MREWLDLAQRRWPDVSDRRALLLRLADAGADRVAAELDVRTREDRAERQRLALNRAGELLDVDLLLADAAWR